MRPALKSYVYFVPTADGVYFRAGSRAFELRAPGAYELVSRLVARLDGSNPQSVIAQNLPAKVQPLFEKLVDALRSHGMLVNADEGSESVEPHLLRIYNTTLLYLRDNVEGFQAAFRKWRETRYAVGGHGYALKAACRALARQGIRRLTIVPDAGCKIIDEIRFVLDEHRSHDAEFEYSALSPEHAHTLNDANWLFAADDLQAMDTKELMERLRKEGVSFLAAGVLHGHGIVGPSGRRGAATFFDLRDRLRPVEASHPKLHSPASCSMIGNSLALHALNLACGIHSGRLNHQFVRVTPLLETTMHPVFPSCRLAPSTIQTLELDKQDGESEGTTEFELLRNKLAPLFDPLSGIFSDSEAKRLDQLPLHHDAISIRPPASGFQSEVTVLAWGLTPADAGARAIRNAVATYGEVIEAAGGAAPRALIAHESEARWFAQAFAAAILRSGLLHSKGVVSDVPVSESNDPSVLQLARIYRLYRGAWPKTKLYSVSGLPAYLAETRGENGSEFAFGSTPHEAIEGSIGGMCSRLQFPASSSRTPPWSTREVTTIRDFTEIVKDAETAHADRLSAFGYSVKRAPFAMDDSFRALGLFVGSLELEARN